MCNAMKFYLTYLDETTIPIDRCLRKLNFRKRRLKSKIPKGPNHVLEVERSEVICDVRLAKCELSTDRLSLSILLKKAVDFTGKLCKIYVRN